MPPEKVTVAITNYNGYEHLPPCLEAVRRLDWPDFDVLLVDNASTDASLELVRERYPEVKVVPLAENRGPGPARNAALREAATDLVLSIDNDAVVEPDSLRLLVEAMRARPDAVACQPRVVYDAEPDRIQYDGGDVHYLGMISLRNFRVPAARCDTGVRDEDVLIAVAILWNRAKLAAGEGFDEDFFVFFEDQDFAHRLRLEGHAILSVPRARVRHRHGTAGVSYRPGGALSERRAYLFTRNRLWLIAKNFASRTIVLVLPALVAYEVVWMLYLTSKGRFGAWRRGIADAWRGRAGVRRKRREIQTRRVLRDRDLLVGGPLTFAVPDSDRTAQRLAIAVLNACFRTYWACVRVFV